jgi:tight adherence protein C
LFFLKKREQKKRRELVRKASNKIDGSKKHLSRQSSSLKARIITLMQNQTLELSFKRQKMLFSQGFWRWGTKKFDDLVLKSGQVGLVSLEGFVQTRVLLGLGALAIGAVLGVMFSYELACVLSIAGAFCGFRLAKSALKSEASFRKSEMEHSLSEMIEVLTLGLRSGLAFDRAFELYCQHFDTGLSRECKSCYQLWTMGLSNREEALRSLGTTYDSVLFSRMVESIVRSLRFGSSLADSLEAVALEARVTHKAYMEEKVAKAPVKMLIPTAALILPAMLLFVLGPIMLEMIQGF